MPVLKYQSRPLAALGALVPEITYVMCGAGGETSSALLRAFPQARFIGFEPDLEEWQRLKQNAPSRFTYLNAAVAGRNEQRKLFVTRSPECSSLLRPNQTFFAQFKDCGPPLDVVGEKLLDVVSLDSFLPKNGVHQIDFLHLDTQGSELEILQGARTLLSSGTVGVKTEVEFSPLYQDQPLFGDVDRFLRGLGFMLFDLTRIRCRREAFPDHALTRGQLLWGDAVYLRDYASLVGADRKLLLFKLCLLAAYLQFHDYALQVLDYLIDGQSSDLSEDERGALRETRRQYIAQLKKSSLWLDLLFALEAAGLRRPIKEFGRLISQLGDRFRKDRQMAEYNWTD